MARSFIYYDPELGTDLEAESSVEETAAAAETVAADLADIEAEPGVNAMGEEVTESATEIDYYAIASEAVERAQLASLEAAYQTEMETELLETEESTLSLEENFNLDAALTSVKSVSLTSTSTSSGAFVLTEQNAYQLQLDGDTYYVWFPSGARLEVSDDGYIYNATDANISGVLSSTLDGVDYNSYNDTLTIAPMFTSSGNNNAYRYGSRVYITDYYESSSSYLQSDVTYVSEAICLKEPGAGYGFSNFQLVTFGMMFTLLLVLLMRFVRK